MKRTPVYHTSIPHFSKIHFTPLCFYERPTLVPAFTNQKKSKEHFHFYEKAESKNSIRYLFCRESL